MPSAAASPAASEFRQQEEGDGCRSEPKGKYAAAHRPRGPASTYSENEQGRDRRAPCPPSAPSILCAQATEACGGAQHVTPGAEDRERGNRPAPRGSRTPLLGALDPELGDETWFCPRPRPVRSACQARRAVRPRRRAGRRRSGNASPSARPVIVERPILPNPRNWPRIAPADAAIAQQRPGLHLLQPGDVHRLAVAEAAFAPRGRASGRRPCRRSPTAPRQRARQQQAGRLDPCGSRRG